MIFPRRRRNRIACGLALCCILVIAANVYLFSLSKDGITQKQLRSISETGGAKPTIAASKHTPIPLDVLDLQQSLRCTNNRIVPWSVADAWVGPRQTYPASAPRLGCLMHQMATAKIINATAGKGGTQMKLLLTLEGGQKVVFKPKRYPRDYIVQGTPYAGFDRHNGEIATFHLSRLLGMQRGPIVVGRRVNLSQEILPVADKKLLATFLTKGDQLCFYGICYYCVPKDSACAENGWMDGAVILWFPSKVTLTKPIRHPWSRTYKAGVLAQWEESSDYCEVVRKKPRYKSGPLLLDIMDTSIIDFLIGNADRHNYQIFEGMTVNMLVLLDNGKSFGNSFHDEDSILSPLMQCCILRQTTWESVLHLANSTLSLSLRSLLAYDPLAPVLTEEHLKALDRRLDKVVEVVKKCFDQNGKQAVLMGEK